MFAFASPQYNMGLCWCRPYEQDGKVEKAPMDTVRLSLESAYRKAHALSQRQRTLQCTVLLAVGWLVFLLLGACIQLVLIKQLAYA